MLGWQGPPPEAEAQEKGRRTGQGPQNRDKQGQGPSCHTATSQHRAVTGGQLPPDCDGHGHGAVAPSLFSPEAMQPPLRGTGQVAKGTASL